MIQDQDQELQFLQDQDQDLAQGYYKGGAERFLVYIISYHAQWNVASYVTSLEEIIVDYESKLGLFNDIYCPWVGRMQ